MTSFPSSLLPSLSTGFAIGLAILAAVVGKIFSDADTLTRNVGAGARWRGWLAASVEQGSIPENLGGFLLALLQDLDVCRKSRFTVLPMAFFYLSADMLTFLTTSNDSLTVDERSFSEWIKCFLDPEGGEYHYPPQRLYAARCRVLGSFGAQGNHEAGSDQVPISYVHDRHHILAGGEAPQVQIVSVPALLRDFEVAIRRFAEALQRDQETRDRAESRWPSQWGLGSLIASARKK